MALMEDRDEMCEDGLEKKVKCIYVKEGDMTKSKNNKGEESLVKNTTKQQKNPRFYFSFSIL